MNASEHAAHRWFDEVWNGRSTAAIHELLAPDAVGHLEGPVPEVVGVEQFIQVQQGLLNAMPDVRITILKSLANESDVAVFWQAQARGGAIRFRGTTWLRVVGGRIVEGWDCWDYGALSAKLAERPACA
ncbi:MAG: ester cyclase [Verrucomicrobia bacterium]|nr:ester cyclase [Verrucomicrobiota bacterium]